MRRRFVYVGGGGRGDQILATTNDTRNWYGFGTPERTIFNPRFKVKPGKVEVRHLDWAKQYEGCILVEPHIKGTYSGENKRWPWDYWIELVQRSPWPLSQFSYGKDLLPGVTPIESPSFDHAVSLLAVSRGAVLTEGGLHHAAGALGKPAVVIFGAFNLAFMMGYDFHFNLEEQDPVCLGRRKTHPACLAAMRRITVDRVLEAMHRMLG